MTNFCTVLCSSFIFSWIISCFLASNELQQILVLRGNLSLLLEEPKKEDGEEIFKLVSDYYDILRKVKVGAIIRNPEDIETIRVISTKGGPQHIDDVPYNHYAKLFHWSTNKIAKYRDLIDSTQKLFDNLVDIATENRTMYSSNAS
uniref:Uncharacterized protein n=1 Tax=Clastoptera arizonana TaxID=38151 RepID=A0A1B6DX97_9HEMI